MTQKARPIRDISTGSWTPTPIWSRIDEEQPDDATSAVESSGDPSSDVFSVRLREISPPQAGPATLSVRFKKSGTGCDITGSFTLYQGATFIGAVVVPSVPDNYITVDLPLTANQVASITDFADLRLVFEAACGGASCDVCSDAPVTDITIDLAGIANAVGCGNCTALNTQHSLHAVGTGCTWASDLLTTCSPQVFLNASIEAGVGANTRRWRVKVIQATTSTLLAEWLTSDIAEDGSGQIACAANRVTSLQSGHDTSFCDLSSATCEINKP